MKVLVVRFSSIGDIVLTTPILRCLKQQVPGCQVHFLTKAAFRQVVAPNPNIDKIHLLEDSFRQLITSLQAERFDFIVDLHNNIRSRRVIKALGIKSASFSKLNLQKWLLVNFKVNLMPRHSIVDRYFDAVKPLRVRNDHKGLDYFIPKEAELSNTDVPMSHWAGYVACVIGGSYETKKLPIAKWQEFCKLIPFPVILLGGPEDREAGDEIASPDGIRIYNACGKFSLNESAWLVSKARIVITNDTGLMHIAAAYDKKIVSLWGNTAPEMGMFPYFGNNAADEPIMGCEALEINKLYCHPCSKLGYNKCPEGHFKCMNQLNMNLLSDFVKKSWGLTQR